MKLSWAQLKERIGMSNKNLMLFSMLRNIVNSMPEKKEEIFVEMFKTIMNPNTDEFGEVKALRDAAEKLQLQIIGTEMITNPGKFTFKLTVEKAEELMAKNPIDSGIALIPIKQEDKDKQ